jgi:two-component system response regulator AtoC
VLNNGNPFFCGSFSFLSMVKLLIADDDKNLREVISTELSHKGYLTASADSGIQAMTLLERDEYDVLLLDLSMPGLGGIDVLRKIKTAEIPTEVIILTGNATVSTAVEAMKLGACDYLTKPFRIDELKVVVDRAFERKRLLDENLLLKTQIKRQTVRKDLITKSPTMLAALEIVRKVAVSDFPVLIYGESGVGKELVANAIHESSTRSEGPLVAVNCGAIHENVIESELFGHEKGAFTGAHARKPGLLETAHGGTLFLDEVGELSPQLQVKLLRVIETKSFFRVGGIREITVDVRYVSATNKDLKKEVQSGNFRQDLYYRLSGLMLSIPPLRERREDIPLLVDFVIENNPPFRYKRFSKGALEALSSYSWPGNVRELQNVIYRTLLLSGTDVVERTDLPADLTEVSGTPGRRLEDVEKNHILKVLRETNGQKGKAAQVLGIDPKTLYRKLSLYGIKE